MHSLVNILAVVGAVAIVAAVIVGVLVVKAIERGDWER